VTSVEALLTQVEETTRRYQRQDLHIGSSDEESPWLEYLVPNLLVRYVMFDVRQGQLGVLLRATAPTELGRHKHRSPVTGFTLDGYWAYREYGWVSRAGDYVHESPGTIHTLYTDSPTGFTTYFVLNGCIEYFDEQDNVVDTQDVFWFINHYVQHCEANGLPINDSLFR
jgi:hypothetical protein